MMENSYTDPVEHLHNRYILVRNKEGQEAVAVFLFDRHKHRGLQKQDYQIDGTNYRFIPADLEMTPAQIESYIAMKALPVLEQKKFYQPEQT